MSTPGTAVSPGSVAPDNVHPLDTPEGSFAAPGVQGVSPDDSEANPVVLSPEFGKDRSKLKRGLPDAAQTAEEMRQRLEEDPDYIFELLEQSLGDVAGSTLPVDLDPMLMDSDPETLKKLAELLAGSQTNPPEGTDPLVEDTALPPDQSDSRELDDQSQPQ